MSYNENFVERREHERFQIDGGILALLSSSITKFGRINEISMGGLSVRHFDGEVWETTSFESDILLNVSRVCLEKVPVKIILDIEIITEGHFKPLSERKSVIQFEKLTTKHSDQLADYIESYAKDDIFKDYY